jgi:hypothetical protein
MAATRDDFEYWLFEMDDKLAMLMEYLPAEVSEKLDYSVSSLTLLERWLLNSYPSVRSILKESEKETLDQLSRYVGETIRKNLGGIWNIDLKNKKNVYFRIPVVQQKGTWTECPLTMMTAATDRRKGDYMEGIMRSLLEDYKKS